MPGSMLSTSSVHSIVNFPPCLPSTGAPPPAFVSESPPPPQPARTAPARGSARNAPLAMRCMRFLPPAAPAGSSTVTRYSSCARGARTTTFATGGVKERLPGRRDLLVGADHAPGGLHRIEEVRRAAVAQRVVVVVVLLVAAVERRAAERADGAAELLGDRAEHGERAQRIAALVVVDHERVLEREDGGLDVVVLLDLVGTGGGVVVAGPGHVVLDAHE